MFCFQCQEAAKNEGCISVGICGKKDDTAAMQDVLIYTVKGLSWLMMKSGTDEDIRDRVRTFIIESLFSTVTNVNFDESAFVKLIKKGLNLRDTLTASTNLGADEKLPDACVWFGESKDEFNRKAEEVSIKDVHNNDMTSLRELIVYGVKGAAAYLYHAMQLGYDDLDLHSGIHKELAATIDETKTKDELIGLVVETGNTGVGVMALLDKANTETYGTPEITKVKTGVGTNPGILISGHDLKDMEELLKQTEGTGVDVYTHSEMLPAHYYPAFKKYDHFVGNYGNAWWEQAKEFESFNGPVLMTTNCLVPPKDSYKDRVYTTGVVGFKGLKHIGSNGGAKDFSSLIEHAKQCAAPTELENGEITGGFAHAQTLALADKILEAVQQGAVKKFVVMAGCDGRHPKREYYTDFASELPDDTVILTAGCAKYRYNKLELGDIGGIPRVLDAGQCNDSYSLAVVALKLKEVLELDDINDLPIVYNIAWYEQKAVIVLLALLALGVKNIKLGPTLPAFLTPNVTKLLVETFQLSGINDVEEDMQAMLA